MKNTFGAFISSKRLEKQISLRNFADAIGISPVYASHIERNMRSSPSAPVLKRISNILVLNSDEEEMMYMDFDGNGSVDHATIISSIQSGWNIKYAGHTSPRYDEPISGVFKKNKKCKMKVVLLK